MRAFPLFLTACLLAAAAASLDGVAVPLDDVGAVETADDVTMLQTGAGAKVADTEDDRLGYHPDGMNDADLWALAHMRNLGGDSQDGDLGESAMATSSHKQHQPIKSQGEKWGSKEMCIMKVDPLGTDCKRIASSNCIIKLEECMRPTGWYYNRFTKRIEGEEYADKNGNMIQKCLHRTTEGADKIKGADAIVVGADCNDDKEQVWDYQCDAFTYLMDAGKDTEGIRVLTAKEDGHIILEKYFGEPEQKWTYHEVVRHSRCRTKRYKVMKFKGSLATTVVMKKFVAMPNKGVTVMFWMKGEKGTPFSYASDGVPTPPYQTQIGANIDGSGVITLDLFDVNFNTGVYAPKHQWFNLAVTWDKTFGKLILYKDGNEVWSKATHDAKPANGKPAFDKSEFISSGCVMLGQKAKRPCTERMPETSYLGEMSDFQVLDGALTSDQIKDQMFKPVEPEYLSTIQDIDPVKVPDRKFLRLAYLSRQYGSQEMNIKYPPSCTLEEEKRLSMMSATGDGPNWAQLCDDYKNSKSPRHPTANRNIYSSDCKMDMYGVGDVHYKSFAGCKFDDQLPGMYVTVQMKPEFYELHPLTIQHIAAPSQAGWCGWCQAPTTKTLFNIHSQRTETVTFPAMLAYINGCAIKFKDERVSAGFGGYHYNAYRRRWNRSSYTRQGEWEKDGEITNTGGHTTIKTACGGAGNCIESKYFRGHVSTGSMDITMDSDGTRVVCSSGSLRAYIPRKLEMKIMGGGGSMHPDRVSGESLGGDGKCDEWTTGTNKPNVDHMNKLAATGSMHGYSVPSGTAREAMVVGKQVPNCVRPSDGGGNCRRHHQYHQPNSDFNSNRPWKGIAKFLTSWKADDIAIPSIFGKKLTDEIRSKGWDDLSPAGGKAKDQTNSMRALAEKGCENLKPFPKRFNGCVFDFMSQGKKAAGNNLKMTQKQTSEDQTKPTVKSVRDASGGNNPAEWVGHPSWGCVDEFSLHVTDKAKKHMNAKHMKSQKDGMCKCQHKYLGVCAYDHFICIADIKL